MGGPTPVVAAVAGEDCERLRPLSSERTVIDVDCDAGSPVTTAEVAVPGATATTELPAKIS